MLKTHTIRQPYPCCRDNEELGLGRVPQCRLVLLDDLPRQRFERRCPNCGDRFDIRVETTHRPGVIIDTCEWTDLQHNPQFDGVLAPSVLE